MSYTHADLVTNHTQYNAFKNCITDQLEAQIIIQNRTKLKFLKY